MVLSSRSTTFTLQSFNNLILSLAGILLLVPSEHLVFVFIL